MNLPSLARRQSLSSRAGFSGAGARRPYTHRRRVSLACAVVVMAVQTLFGLPAMAESKDNPHVTLLRGQPGSESLLIGYLLTNCKSGAAPVSPRSKILKVKTTLEETTGLIAPITESFELSAGEFHEISADFSYFGSGESTHVVGKHLFFPIVNAELSTPDGGAVLKSCELHITNTIVGPGGETRAALISVLGTLGANLE